MNFHRHEYEMGVVLGDPNSRPIWHTSTWDGWYSLLGGIESGDRGKSALRVNQYENKKIAKYGKLSFAAESFRKWLNSDDDKRLMVNVEIWSPHWNVCAKADMAPDIFIGIYNELAGRCYSSKPVFNPLVVAARRKGSTHPLSFDQIMTTTNEVCGGRSFVNRTIPWGIASGSGFTRSIQDMGLTALFRPGKVHERPIDENTFDPNLRLERFVVA